jgi:hypothetical protein
MDTIENIKLLTAQPIEAAPKLAAGRLPLMAFVDAETESIARSLSDAWSLCDYARRDSKGH